jgi:hypothetical protein
MKGTISILIIFVLSACNNQADQSVVDVAKPILVDSFYMDSSEIKGGETYKEFYDCKFDSFIANEKTPKLAKDIYLDKDWNLNNDEESLALLCSLNAKNTISRPFYFKVVTKSYKKSDGYYSEGLGSIGKEYLENNTREFISYFDNKNCFTSTDLGTWADIVILEFSISGDGEHEKPIVDDYIKKLKTNCDHCTPIQKENLDKFGLILQKKWREYLKNPDEKSYEE